MEYNLVKLEQLRKVTSPNDDDLILLSNTDTGAYQSAHMTVADAFNTINIRLSGAQQKPFANLRDTSCIDLIIDESSLKTQADANQAILDIFNTFGSHICELEEAITEPFVIIHPSPPDASDLEDGWIWVDSSGYSSYEIYVLHNGTWVPINSTDEDLTDRVEIIEDNLELEIDLEFSNNNDIYYYRTLITKNKHSEFAYYDWKWEISLNGDGSVDKTITSETNDLSDDEKTDLGFVDASSYLLRFTNKDNYPDAQVRYEGKVTFGEKLDAYSSNSDRIENTKTAYALSGGSEWLSAWGLP